MSRLLPLPAVSGDNGGEGGDQHAACGLTLFTTRACHVTLGQNVARAGHQKVCLDPGARSKFAPSRLIVRPKSLGTKKKVFTYDCLRRHHHSLKLFFFKIHILSLYYWCTQCSSCPTYPSFFLLVPFGSRALFFIYKGTLFHFYSTNNVYNAVSCL